MRQQNKINSFKKRFLNDLQAQQCTAKIATLSFRLLRYHWAARISHLHHERQIMSQLFLAFSAFLRSLYFTIWSRLSRNGTDMMKEAIPHSYPVLSTTGLLWPQSKCDPLTQQLCPETCRYHIGTAARFGHLAILWPTRAGLTLPQGSLLTSASIILLLLSNSNNNRQ